MHFYKANDECKAAEYWIEAAEQGHVGAQCLAGMCYRFGAGVPQNAAKAVEWFTKAAEKEHAEAQFNLGMCFEEGGIGVTKDLRKALEYYTKAAEQGHIRAPSRYYVFKQ